MRQQIPHGDADLICPLHRASMAKVCHKCPLWTHVRGVNPNTGEDLDRWNCALAWLPSLLIETAQQARQGAAATESFRNEVARRHDEAMASTALPSGHHSLRSLPPPVAR